VQIRAKSLKIRGKICGSFAKMCEYLHNIAVYALILQKSADLFLLDVMYLLVVFGELKGNLGKFGNIWAKMVFEVL